MITNWIIQAVSTVVSWILGMLPVLSLPTSLTDTGPGSVHATIAGGVASLWSLDSFLPMGHLVGAAALVLAALVAAVTIRLVRIVASFLTAGGGSAA